VRLGRGPALVATLLSPFALYFIARSAAAGTGSPGAAVTLAAFPPADYRGAIRRAARLTQNPVFKAGPEMLELSRHALAAAPTTFEPFYVAAKAEEGAGRLDHAIRLMEESRRRRPSHAATRLQLIIYYGRARRFDPLLEELDMALRLNEEARRLILPELTRLIADPVGRPALARILSRGPAWRDDFFRAAKGRKVKPEDAQALMNLVRARTGGRADAERGLYLQALLEAGDYARARALWSAALPAAEKPMDGLLFNGGFAASHAAEPFNWQLHEDDVGRAELATERGRPHLELAYYGGRDLVLAEQTLALRPGRYRLSFAVRSDDGIKSGDLSWRIACGSSDALLSRVSLGGAGPTPTIRRAGFDVPAGCGVQRLYLAAQPGDVSAEVRAEVSAMEIARDG
jgi:tetratricopeptide (TPR) repeat protein